VARWAKVNSEISGISCGGEQALSQAHGSQAVGIVGVPELVNLQSTLGARDATPNPPLRWGGAAESAS